MTAGTAAATGREAGIELGRLVAMVAVICLHVRLDPAATGAGWYAVVNQLARFAVPFFFVAMGYFSRIASGRSDALPAARRLLLLYLAWSAIYLLVFGWPEKDGWRALLHGGNTDALWFLLSAALSLAFAWAVHRLAGLAGLLLAGALLYAAGLAIGYYAPLLFGRDLLAVWNARDGLTFGVPFIAIGVWLSAAQPRLPPLAAGLLLVLAACLQMGEVLALSSLGVYPLRHDFMAATLLLGPAAFLFFRSLNGARWIAAPARLGGLALGIYVTHPALLRLAEMAGQPADPPGFALRVAALFTAALGLAALLNGLPLLRLLVTTRGGLVPGPASSKFRPADPVAQQDRAWDS